MSSPFECSLMPDSCPSPSGCFLVSNSSGVVVSSYCACLNYYNYDGFPSCDVPTSSTIFLFVFFCSLLFLQVVIFAFRTFMLFRFLKYDFQRKHINLTLLSTLGAFVAAILLIVFTCMQIVGISNPTSVSALANGLRLPYLHPQRNYVGGFTLIIVSTIIILHTGAFAEVSYSSSKMRPLKTLKKVYFLTFFAAASLVVTSVAFLVTNMLQAAYILLIVTSSTLLVVFTWASTWIIRELQKCASSGGPQYVAMINIIKRTRFLIAVGLTLTIIGTAVNIYVPIPAHSQEWAITGPCLSLLGFMFDTLGLFAHGIKLLTNRLEKSSSSNGSPETKTTMRSNYNNNNRVMNSKETAVTAHEVI